VTTNRGPVNVSPAVLTVRVTWLERTEIEDATVDAALDPALAAAEVRPAVVLGAALATVAVTPRAAQVAASDAAPSRCRVRFMAGLPGTWTSCGSILTGSLSDPVRPLARLAGVKLSEHEVRIPAPDCEIRAVVVSPDGAGPWPGVLLYTDIFQVTESTLRTARRLASAGFVVCLPEIYPRGELAGVALEFDEPGKQAGLAGAAATTTGEFDSDRVAVLDYLEQRADLDDLFCVGFCIGGHLAFRAAFDSRVAATVCFYPTGLHNGALGADADAGTLARCADIQGRLMIVFGSRDPHVPAPARLQVVSALYAAGLEDLELHVYAGGEHAFMRDVGARHDPVLTDHALAEAVSFLSAR